ncbi:heavy metal translocating P-type ATPase [Gemmobacter sp.]|uniref:heavy metal translocating P-type ATPase n=1 Tax=Gemmobacter sp. TaxID=1898957 RepID=UPI002AFF6E63|nr:heavy metal translocating P-type ATPase [Gemmobacter sp.]
MTAPLTVEIEGLYCAACVGRAEKVLRAQPGIASAEVNLAQNTARIGFAGAADLAGADTALKRAGYGLGHEVTRLALDGMTCASCVNRVEKALLALPGVESAAANLADTSVTVRHVAGPEMLPAMLVALGKAGYPAEPLTDAGADRQAAEEAAMKRRFLWALVLTLPVFVLEMGGHLIPAFHHWVLHTIGQGPSWTVQALLTTAILAGPGRVFLTRGLPSLFRLSPDMNALVAVGTLSAWAYSMVALLVPQVLPENARAVYFEAAAVIVTLILMGRWLEARARGRTGAAIRRLVDLQPDTALVETPEGDTERSAHALHPGDILRIRPGERLAADGVVISGTSYIDESMITGEPVPVAKAEGAEVTGGTVNGTGALRVRVTRAGTDTRLHQIVRMVGDAQAGKLPIQALVDKVTAVFVPVVMGLALLAVVVWLLSGAPLTQALVAGVSVLIVACPCAMGLATPTSILVGTGRAAELGVLFRKGEALQRLSSVQGVAFDKTGTLTEGRPELTDVVLAGGMDEGRVLALAAAVEAQSEHPVALAIQRGATARGLVVAEASDVQAVPGQGVTGLVGGARVVLGNPRLMQAQGVAIEALTGPAAELAARGRTVLYAAIDGQPAALLAVADPIKPGAAPAIAALKAMGLQVAMISGDAEATARAVAGEIGIDTVVAGVLPEGKVQAIQGLGPMAFVGDGINDAPVLAASEVGLAMGQGTDVAIEAADVILTSGDPRAVATAVTLARATLRNIRQNLFWAFAYNAALIPVAAGVFYPAFGLMLSPMLAAGAMALSSVFVLSNALRLRRAGHRIGEVQ